MGASKIDSAACLSVCSTFPGSHGSIWEPLPYQFSVWELILKVAVIFKGCTPWSYCLLEPYGKASGDSTHFSFSIFTGTQEIAFYQIQLLHLGQHCQQWWAADSHDFRWEILICYTRRCWEGPFLKADACILSYCTFIHCKPWTAARQ